MPLNHTTKRHPRTLDEAFGPHTSHHISEPDEQPPYRLVDLLVLAACLLGLAAVILDLAGVVR